MSDSRILVHPILGRLDERLAITFEFESRAYSAYEGDTIAAALLAAGVRTLRHHEETGTPRGIYCNIGHCFECRVTVDGKPGVRACLTELKDGMKIQAGQRLPAPLKKGEHER